MASWAALSWVRSGGPADLFATAAGAMSLVGVTWPTGKRVPARYLFDAEGRPVAYRDRLGVLGWHERQGR